jgi:hypothetical protein
VSPRDARMWRPTGEGDQRAVAWLRDRGFEVTLDREIVSVRCLRCGHVETFHEQNTPPEITAQSIRDDVRRGAKP